MITLELERITPYRAHYYLSLSHPKNREIDLDKVDELVEVIRNGEWKLNNHLIAFDEQGFLVDGQHRLCAIGCAETSVLVGVMRGVSWHES